jgi:hypothetical protein
MSTPWDELQRAYCNGEALWTYPTTLFLLALEGVVVEEMSPGAGATKRGACCTHFLGSIETHSLVQDFFFDHDFRLRCHDCRVNIAGGFSIRGISA